MDALQNFRTILLFTAGGLRLADATPAATLLVDNSSISLTGSIQSQNVSVTSPDGATFNVGAPVYTNAPAGLPHWLSATAIGCTGNSNCAAPATLNLSLTNDLGQYSGTFTATVTLTPLPGGATVTINVTFYPGPNGIPGSLSVAVSAANPVSVVPLAYSTAQGTLPAQQVVVTGTPSYSAGVGTLSGGPWLLIQAGAFSGMQVTAVPSSQLLTITLNAAALSSLAPALYQGFVVVTGADGTSMATIDVNLALNGGVNGAVSANPSTLTFAYSTNASPLVVPPETIVVSTPVGSSFSVTTDHPEWIVIPAPGIGTIPGNIQVMVNPSSFQVPSTQTGHVTITSGSFTQQVTVQLVVSSTPVLWARTAGGGGSAVFTSQGSVSTPISQSVSLTASDGSSPALTITSSPAWTNVSLNGNTLTIAPSVSGTAPAVLSGAVVITAAGMANSPVSIPVVLTENGGGASGPLTLNPSSLNFTALQGGAAPASQTLSVSAPSTTAFSVSASTATGVNWLQVSPGSGGSTNATLTVSVDPTLVTPSTTPYTGTISLGVANESQPQTVPVTLTVTPVSGGNITTDTKSVNLTAQVGTAAQSATVTVSNAAAGTAPILFNVTTSLGTPWLRATPAQAATQSVVTITADPSGLTANTYTGQVIITPSGGNPLTVNVTFTVQSLPVISASRTSFTFSYQTGGTAPSAQTVQISGGAFTAAVTSGSGWLSVSPDSGSGTTNLTVSVNPVSQSSGSETGVISVTGSNNTVLIFVTLNVTLPLPTVTSVVNGASYQSGAIAGGEVISLFGTDLGPSTAATAQLTVSGTLATTLQGVQVLVNGFPAPLVYASSTQVTAVVPYQLANFLQANVQVVYLNQRSNVTSVAVATTAPAIFTLNSAGTGPGARNVDFSPNGPGNPVIKGGYAVFFLTGEGPLIPTGVTGRVNPANGQGVAQAALPVGVLIDNQAANWTYAGGIAGVVEGIMQLNVQIPLTVRSGDLPVVVTIGGAGTQSGVTVSVK